MSRYGYPFSKVYYVSGFSAAASILLFLLMFSTKNWQPIWDPRYPTQSLAAIGPLLRDHITSFSFSAIALFVGIFVVQEIIERTNLAQSQFTRYVFNHSFCAFFVFICWVGMYRGLFEFNGNFRLPPEYVAVDFVRIFQLCSIVAFFTHVFVLVIILLLLKIAGTRTRT